jgi:hypothetical protein
MRARSYPANFAACCLHHPGKDYRLVDRCRALHAAIAPLSAFQSAFGFDEQNEFANTVPFHFGSG